ncbi:MBL fold metallo-hydrolase [Shouchella patagoniensis]|uniref:MBL fold metallo-hydrolase n=1 Tax=Shouchella patagoniensis TaxID=228576 RepID=UPI0009957B18|nr:MBL fold metallo-hydrolase [Shouchella patagoniensis]
MKKKRFENMDQIHNNHRMSDFIRWYKERFRKNKDLDKIIDVNEKPELTKLHKEDRDSITWAGHATFLIQIAGMNILTDPVWSKFMGTTKRSVPQPIPLDVLPAIDFVLISHGHYDHLDFKTLKKVPGNPHFIVPAGLKNTFLKKGWPEEVVKELHWWEYMVINELSFSFVPAQHWVRRGLFDMNLSHWGGFVISSKEKTIYFAGDSGYFQGFKQIAENVPPIDYALLPIGAYEPEWFMELDHMAPEQTVQAFIDLKAKQCIPMHYGTFRLADDTGPEALKRFEQEWKRRNLKSEQKSVLSIASTLWI